MSDRDRILAASERLAARPSTIAAGSWTGFVELAGEWRVQAAVDVPRQEPA